MKRCQKQIIAIRADEVLCLGPTIPALSPPPLLLLGSNKWKEKENIFFFQIFLLLFIIGVWFCVFFC